jgi:hypothetical protein
MFALDLRNDGVRRSSGGIVELMDVLHGYGSPLPAQGEGEGDILFRATSYDAPNPLTSISALPKGRSVTDASYRTVAVSFFTSVGAKAPLPSSR